MKNVKAKEVSFGRLNSSTSYNINVVAIAGKYESIPSIITTYTSPKPPHTLVFVSAELHSVSISWSPPPMLATGEVVNEYFVKYSRMDMNGSRIIVGTQKIQSSLKTTNINVTSLAQGEVYQFSVKVWNYL